MNIKDEIHIFLSFDDKYVPFAGTVIVSALYNASGRYNYNFYALTNGISPKNQEILKSLSTKFPYNIEFILFGTDEFKDWPTNKNFPNLINYYRLKIPSLKPNLNKAIYIDCDTIINQNIEELWNEDINDYYLAGVPDLKLNLKHNRKPLLEIPENYIYINSGVLLLNLTKWRQDNIFERLENYKSINFDKSEKFGYPDQDIINAVLFDKIKVIDFKWNILHYMVYPKYWIKYFTALTKPHIIHFSGPKPWTWDCFNPYRFKFRKYFKLTPWYKDYRYKFIYWDLTSAIIKKSMKLKEKIKFASK